MHLCVCVCVCKNWASKSDLKHRTWCVHFVNIQLKPQNIRLTQRVYTQKRCYDFNTSCVSQCMQVCVGGTFWNLLRRYWTRPFSTHFYSDTCCSFQTMRAFPDRPINPFSLCHEAHFTVRAEFTKVSGSSSLQDGLTSLQGNNIYYNYGYLSASFGINWKYLVFYSDVYCFFNNSPCKNVCHFQEWRSLQVLNICIKK